MPLLKIKIELNADQFKGETGKTGKAIDTLKGKGTLAFDSLTAKVKAFSFAFNQVAAVASKVARVVGEPIRVFSELQSAMANVESLGVPNIQKLTAEVLDMSSRFGADQKFNGWFIRGGFGWRGYRQTDRGAGSIRA